MAGARAEPVRPITGRNRALAWTTHLVTASGAVFGLLALIAVMKHDWLLVFLWLAAALFVDSVDGTIARMTQVKQVIPGFDGALLDNIVDYLTFVIVPAFFLYEANLLPRGYEIPVISAVVLASAYQFCQTDAKTEDNYFKGFPSYWNGIIFYLFFLSLNPWINLTVVVVFCILVFVPFLYVYPSRTTRYRGLTIAISALWALACLVILAQYWRNPLDGPHPWLVWGSLLYIPYYIAISVLSRRPVRSRDGAAP